MHHDATPTTSPTPTAKNVNTQPAGTSVAAADAAPLRLAALAALAGSGLLIQLTSSPMPAAADSLGLRHAVLCFDYIIYICQHARAHTHTYTCNYTLCVRCSVYENVRLCLVRTRTLFFARSLALPAPLSLLSVCAHACPCAMRAHVCGECACPPDSEGPTTRPPPLSPQESAVPLQPTPTPRLHQRQTAARTADAVVAPARASSGCWELLPPRLLSSVRHCEPGPEAQTCPPPRPRQRQHRRPPPPTRILRN